MAHEEYLPLPSSSASLNEPSNFLPPFSTHVLKTWLSTLSQARTKNPTTTDIPTDPTTLLSTSTPLRFSVGTGLSLLQPLIPTILSETRSELIIVTCFWSKDSESVAQIAELLRGLSSRRSSENDSTPLRVYILLSSLSPLQKLFHPPRHRTLPPSALNLPSSLPGITLKIRSLFLKPFSVMHPKYIIADRTRAWVMSWNLSWEKWFEGCLEMEGEAVWELVAGFFKGWGEDDGGLWEGRLSSGFTNDNTTTAPPPLAPLLSSTLFPKTPIPTLLLPHPHHRNPHFRPFLPFPTPPPTPLNTFLLTLLAHSKTSIRIQTPNLTSPPVLDSLLSALSRGVNITITTTPRMMWLEQLATAGSTTECRVRSLKRRARRLKLSENSPGDRDLESGGRGRGSLRIRYYTPRPDTPDPAAEPLKSHLKLTIVDDEIAVLGSGNMDRASWYTSRELGIALFGKEAVERIKSVVGEGMEGRMRDG